MEPEQTPSRSDPIPQGGTAAPEHPEARVPEPAMEAGSHRVRAIPGIINKPGLYDQFKELLDMITFATVRRRPPSISEHKHHYLQH